MLRPTILTGVIKPLTVNANIPQPAFGADTGKEPGNGALEAGNFTAETTSGDDEVPPDFSALDAKDRGEESGKAGVETIPAQGAPPAKETAKAPAESEKPSGEPPAKPATPPSKGPNEPIPDVPAFKPGQTPPAGKEDHPTDPLRFKDGTFKPVKEPTPAAKPATPPAAPVAKPPEPAKPLPKDDADLDAIEPKPTASEATKNHFKVLKENVKTARAHARELETKLAEANAKVSGDLPADVKEKLARLDEAEKFKAMFELENDPKERTAYTEKLNKTEDAIVKFLTEDHRLALPKEKADWLKQVGMDSDEAVTQINKWVAQVANGNPARNVAPNPLLARQMEDMFLGRSKIISDRAAEVERLRGDRDGYLAQRQKAETEEFNGWGKKADSRLEQIAMASEWAGFKTAPAGATPEQIAIVEAHNAKVKDEIVPAFQNAITKVYTRDPEKTIEYLFQAFEAQYSLRPRVTELEAENAAHVARIAELEALASGVRGAAQFSTAEQAPKIPVPSGIPIGGDTAKEVGVDEAFAQWEAGRPR